MKINKPFLIVNIGLLIGSIFLESPYLALGAFAVQLALLWGKQEHEL